MAMLPTMDTSGLGNRIASLLLQFLMGLHVPLQPLKGPLYLQYNKISCHLFMFPFGFALQRVTYPGVMAARVDLGG